MTDVAPDTRYVRQSILPEIGARGQARLAAALTHDHVVPVYHVGEQDGRPHGQRPVAGLSVCAVEGYGVVDLAAALGVVGDPV